MITTAFDDEWADDDAEDPSDEDLDDDESDEPLQCPSCGREVHEDTQQCPHCGDWITPVPHASPGKRALFVIAAVLAILGLLWVTVW